MVFETDERVTPIDAHVTDADGTTHHVTSAGVGHGDVYNGALSDYRVDVTSAAGAGSFFYDFAAVNDPAATDAFNSTMALLPDGTTGRLYRLDGRDRHQVATWPGEGR